MHDCGWANRGWCVLMIACPTWKFTRGRPSEVQSIPFYQERLREHLTFLPAASYYIPGDDCSIDYLDCVGLFSSAEACSFQTKARKDRPTHRHYHLIDRDTIAGYLFRFRPVIPPSVPSFLPLSVFFLCSYFLCSYTVLRILISGFFVSTS